MWAFCMQLSYPVAAFDASLCGWGALSVLHWHRHCCAGSPDIARSHRACLTSKGYIQSSPPYVQPKTRRKIPMVRKGVQRKEKPARSPCRSTKLQRQQQPQTQGIIDQRMFLRRARIVGVAGVFPPAPPCSVQTPSFPQRTMATLKQSASWNLSSAHGEWRPRTPSRQFC